MKYSILAQYKTKREPGVGVDVWIWLEEDIKKAKLIDPRIQIKEDWKRSVDKNSQTIKRLGQISKGDYNWLSRKAKWIKCFWGDCHHDKSSVLGRFILQHMEGGIKEVNNFRPEYLLTNVNLWEWGDKVRAVVRSDKDSKRKGTNHRGQQPMVGIWVCKKGESQS